MSVRDRRNFLKGGGIVVGALAAESRVVPEGIAKPGAAAPSTTRTQAAGFGWEICNLSGNGANTYVEVRNNLVLRSVDVDVSASILNAKAAGFAEVLCMAGLCPHAPPPFTPSRAAYINFPESRNFGAVMADNPNGLALIQNRTLLQNLFLSVILKTWVPSDGTASATSRHVSVSPGLSASAGDYLVFHMDHSGVPVDAEMQVVIGYELR